MRRRKDGGPDSPVDAYFLIEVKGLFSLAILKFREGRRESFHSHAFNALTWFIAGDLEEETLDGIKTKYKRSLLPKVTKKQNMHRVKAFRDSWCITLRGPWGECWSEYNEDTNEVTILTNSRKVVFKYQRPSL